jgi:Fe-S cluster assembly scaffold protein SufB
MGAFDFKADLSKVDKGILNSIADLTNVPDGAFNIRKNGQGVVRHSSEHIKIEPKSDKPGIDIYIAPETKGEQVHIPVILTESGLNDTVYNDFYVGEGADVLIVAGCGINNCGCKDSQHDGIHSFHIGKNAKVKYVEKHYGEGDGSGKRILNPQTIVEQDENSYCEMEMIQIKGVTSTVRDTTAHLKAGAKLLLVEKLMTHGNQTAESKMKVYLEGKGSNAQIISRTVGRDNSVQVFKPQAIGDAECRAHVQCDSIIMDNAKISSIPAISANHPDAQLIHEAAIGKINSDQLIKLETFGMTEAEAEAVIIKDFLQ